jgi:hypothetical protein
VRRNHSAEGISSLGTILSLAGLLVVIVIIAVAVSISLPSNNNDTTTSTTTTNASTATTQAGANQANTPVQSTTTSTTGPGLPGTGGAAAIAACQSDVTALTTALAAYQATNGSYPTPPAAWTGATYAANFAPLTSATPPGPFLRAPLGDTKYVIMWDSSGHIWVEPPGTFTATYDATNDGTNPSTCTRVAR